jgi:ABC-type transport system involved in multi-copper enzyme maturation permease subunit
MITQTLAIFADAYRELNAKKLFWIVLSISAVAMLAFAGFKADDQALYYFGFKFPEWGIPPKTMYKTIFTGFVIGLWLTWAATIIALISTASIFPDLISGGSIDLFLSKPISRVRLFFTKYFSGLLFVILQVAVVCTMGYFALGIRAGAWNAKIFWGIPIVVCFFSYLFSICVLLGVVTRSAFAALPLTILFWLLCWGVSTTELVFLQFKTDSQLDLNRLRLQIDTYDKRIAMMQPKPTTQPATTQPAEPRLLTDFKETRARLFDKLPESESNVARWKNWHQLIYSIKTFLPKTSETIALLERHLVSREETAAMVSADEDRKNKRKSSSSNEEIDVPKERTDLAVNNQLRDRSVGWIVGTSLLFEAVVLSLAAWIFHRRDF